LDGKVDRWARKELDCAVVRNDLSRARNRTIAIAANFITFAAVFPTDRTWGGAFAGGAGSRFPRKSAAL
jgi:hypothetical protein